MPACSARSPIQLAAALAGSLLLAACGDDDARKGGPGAGAPAVPTVTVLAVQTGPVPLATELPGRTTPYMRAELRPQVTGIVKARSFTEGSDVKAGQVLYRIDPAPYQAVYDSAVAALARADANVAAARTKAERYAELVKIEAVSKQANDEAIAALKQAQAEVGTAKAALEGARIDLGFTRLTSPISGRIGRSAVTPGALVTANQAQALATVQQLDPIYVDLTQSSAKLLRMRRDFDAGRLKRTGGDSVPVELVLEDGSIYGAKGKLAFSEVAVDEATGSVTLRAVFPNAEGELLPGMYVRARLSQGVRDAILVPHAAVMHDPRGNANVMLVNAKGVVETRVVKAERSIKDKWVVTEGLAPGERVIVEGLQKAKPGAAVRVQQAGAAAPAAAAASALR